VGKLIPGHHCHNGALIVNVHDSECEAGMSGRRGTSQDPLCDCDLRYQLKFLRPGKKER
jgi:hypothetical protein